MIRATLALMLLAASAAPAPADDSPERGREIAEQFCARCHAAGTAGDSPLAAAPPFRKLGQRFEIRDLEESLAEGIVTGHPDMPEFAFEPDDVGAIIAYLKSIQIR